LEVGLRIEPGHIGARRAHVEALVAVGRFEDALVSSREILKLSPGDDAAQEGVVQALHALRRYEAAEVHVRSALAANPHNYGVLVEAGYLRLESGDFTAAKQSFETAITWIPDAEPLTMDSGCAT
jgi:tetratricopeptide (TPR) repeat protein